MAGLITIPVIAVALAMDALAVSIVSGSTCRQLRTGHALRMALFFGGFQALMPLVGSLAGLTVKEYTARYAHWIAFALLTGVGAKMIYESFKFEQARRREPASILVLLVLSVATSIDALAVGVTLSLITSSIITAVTIIGAVTFALSYIGVYIGRRFGHFFEIKIEALGGIVLIGIALKLLLQHYL